MKSGIAFLLAVLIALPSIPATAYQADDMLYNEATMMKDKIGILKKFTNRTMRTQDY